MAHAIDKEWNGKRFITLTTVGYGLASLAFLLGLYVLVPMAF